MVGRTLTAEFTRDRVGAPWNTGDLRPHGYSNITMRRTMGGKGAAYATYHWRRARRQPPVCGYVNAPPSAFVAPAVVLKALMGWPRWWPGLAFISCCRGPMKAI